LVRSIFTQPDAKKVWAQHGPVGEQLEKRFNETANMLAKAAKDIKSIWRQVWSPTTSGNGPTVRPGAALTQDGHLPQPPIIIRLVNAVLAKQNDKWAVTYRYISAQTLEQA